MGSLLDKLLASPLTGLAPWIIYALVEGEGRLELSAAIAFGIALLILMTGWARGSSPKLLEFSDVAFFGALALVIAFGPASTHSWLELWSGEVANIALVVIAVGSILIRRPFTLAYAKEQSDPSEWSDPHFLRANYVITAVWGLAFFIEAASGFYGDAVLHDSNNIWTGWIIQTFPLIVAVQFTLWYPQRLEALAAGRAPESASLSSFVGSVTPWIAIVGVITLFLGDAPTWLGVALIVVGVGLTRLAHSGAPTASPA